MRVSIICLLMTVLAACTIIVEPEEQQGVVVIDEQPAPEMQSTMSDAIKQLANSLFDVPDLIAKDAKIAVGTFGTINSLRLESTDSKAVKQLGLALQEGLKTALTKKRIRVIEYRLTKTISLQKGQDVMLSRNLSDIESNHDIDYFLTGTLLEQPRGVIINAQLVDVQTKQIITAATQTLPQDYWSGSTRSSISEQQIYRFAK